MYSRAPWPVAIVVERELKRALNIPSSTTMVPGFRCVAGQIRCGEGVGLCDTFFVDYAPVYMGDNVGFSFRNMVITSTHDLADFDRIVAKPVVIESNVWITSNVTILAGVRIGANSIIGAGSVVTRDVPSSVLAAGNPCRVVREIDRRGGECEESG